MSFSLPHSVSLAVAVTITVNPCMIRPIPVRSLTLTVAFTMAITVRSRGPLDRYQQRASSAIWLRGRLT